MNTATMLDEIRDATLTYLMLAQALIRSDRAQALFRLGLSEEVADMVAGLTAAQILKIAASNMVMCRFRFDDQVVWNLLTGHGQSGKHSDRAVSGVHATILMSGQLAEAA